MLSPDRTGTFARKAFKITASDGKLETSVGSLERGLSILLAFNEGEYALSNRQLAARTGFSRPTISRLAHALRRLGYLIDYGPRGTYALGPAVLSLGYATLMNMPLTNRARPFMEQLAADLGASVAMGILGQQEVIYVEYVRGSYGVITATSTGSRIPVASTASGRAILAGLSPEDRAAQLEQLRIADPDGFARFEPEIMAAVQHVRDHGFCISYGEWHKDICAVAAPLPDVNTGQVFSITLSQPVFRSTRNELMHKTGPKIAELVRKLATGTQAPAR
jgi:DNA-binding IclR family transcriptional regulator